jgi:two-component system cell cycle sensor histidine kinase/response regulator CckA
MSNDAFLGTKAAHRALLLVAVGVPRMAVVLIVEDEAQVLLLAESYLQEHGHETFSAGTLAEASAILARPDKIDVLFTDIGLRDDLQAGLELAKTAVEHRPDIKVLYATGQTVTDGMRALFVERSAMLVKPYTVDQLLTSLSILGITHPRRDSNT